MASLLITMLTALTVLIAPGASAGLQSSAQRAASESGTWIGQVERDDGHFDYVGSPCPIEAEFCIDAIYRYRIVPTTFQAARALPTVVGKSAELKGKLDPTGDDTHQGTLFVERVTPTS